MSDDICNDDVIQVTIHELSLEDNDHLLIYDGRHKYEPVLANLSGHGEPRVIIASGTAVVIMFNTDDTLPGRGFKLSFIRRKGTPSLPDPVTIKVTETMAEMSVDFLSGIPHNAVFWSKDGVIVQQDDKHTLTVTPAEVSVESEHGINVDGFRASLLIKKLEPRDFGMYKVAVGNRFGISGRGCFLRRRLFAPVIHNYTVFENNATIMVTFSSYPDFEVKWYKTHRINTTGSDVRITTERAENQHIGNENEAIFISILSPETPTQPDYGDYTCIISNDVGTAEVSIYIGFPKTEIPKVLPSSVELKDAGIILRVNFDSNIAYPTATWYHGNVRLETSYKYRSGLTWEGIPSSDWIANGYPSVLHSEVVQLITERRENGRNITGNYIYPSIGGSRSSTQRDANYTAFLTISEVTADDLGLYRVVLKNDAGLANHVIDVTTIEVFPYATCDQLETIQLECNVTSCSGVTLSWIHSVGGDVIRHLPGHQDGSINTLTIPMCMYSDAGTYKCVGTDKQTGSDVAIRFDKTVLTVRAIPVILESSVDIQNGGILLEVPFFSNPPHRLVTWYQNGNKLISFYNKVIATVSGDVKLPMHGKTGNQKGHVTSMGVDLPNVDDYGMYKIAISNEMGNSEHIIHVQNPEYARPVTSSDVSVSFTENSALLNVTFSSYYRNFSVKWYFRGQHVQGGHSVNKYVIQTDPSANIPDLNPLVRTKITKSTTLTVTCLSEGDYGIYDVVVSNKAGHTTIPVRLTAQEQGAPLIIGDMVADVTHSTAELSATFHSSSGYRLVKWLKGDNEITNDSVKYNIVNEDVDIKISYNGETMEETGTITRLSVTSLEDPDYGLYTVQIYNDIGMTDRSVTLDEECT
ncbi:titin-like [Pecten maximus]|uniref:titin-like n=1 Tax=Pecten maximus TaxID=6579 RepID=UPI0014583E49|nr:titin-like [Pecten maximus]